MTTKTIDDLRSRPRVAGHYVTACSPSANSISLLWPDGHVQTVQLDGGTTIVKRENGQEAHVYRRGPSYDAILGEIEGELQRQEDEIQDVLAELQTESDDRIGKIMAGEQVTVVESDQLPTSELCPYDGDHYDCVTCPDADTGKSPKHHSSASLLSGHKRSGLHKRNNPEVAE